MLAIVTYYLFGKALFKNIANVFNNAIQICNRYMNNIKHINFVFSPQSTVLFYSFLCILLESLGI